MARTLITAAVLAASLATALVPVAASAHDHDGYGWHDDRDDDRYDGYGRGDDWRAREHQRAEYARRADYERRAEWQRRAQYQQRAYGYNNGYGGGYNGGYYAQPAYNGYQREAYVAPYRQDNGYRCHSDGTTGAVIGALAGGLLGHEIVGRGDRVAGTAVGGIGGLFAGRAIERGGNRC